MNDKIITTLDKTNKNVMLFDNVFVCKKKSLAYLLHNLSYFDTLIKEIMLLNFMKGADKLTYMKCGIITLLLCFELISLF